jgi:putative DNA primase/helicase
MTTQESQRSNSYIFPEHLAEFQASGITDDISAANFRSIEPFTNPHDSGAEYELDGVFCILIDDPIHNNNGTLSGSAQQNLANTLNSDDNWLFEGFKGKSVKPNNPRKGKQKKVINELLKLEIEQKFIKYESVRGKGNQQVFVPHVTVRVALLIDSNVRYLVPKNLQVAEYVPSSQDPNAIDDNFWTWFFTTPYPLFVTEGAKGVSSIVSTGFPAIGLNGVTGWSNGRDDNENRLIHQTILPFLNGREIILAFDIDKSSKTLKNVKAEKLNFYNCINDKISKLTEIKWEGFKGVDDWLGSMAEDKREVALSKACQNRSEVVSSKPNPNDNSSTKNSGNKDEPAAKASNFTSSIETGLVEIKFDEKGDSKNIPIGNHLEAIARVNNPEGTDATLLLEFKTYYGSISRWSMSRGFLGGDSRDITSELLRLGYHYERGRKKELLEYLHSLGSQIEQTYTVTDSSGWVGKSFVLPHKTHGDPDLRFRDVDPSPDVITEIKGTLQGWKDGVAARCAGNSRLIFGLGCSFAAPLLPIVDIESGGFHLVGETSNGKTTILSVAASVTGVKAIPSWRTTDNALEGGLTAFNHLCMPLDELKQCEARAVGSVVYMLGNGIGKNRSNKNLVNRKSKTWLTIVLSSGELTIGDKMKECGQTIAGGQEVRLPDVPAIPKSSKYGCFETIHGATTAVQFVSALESEVKNHHGTALDDFLSKLVIAKADPQFASDLSKKVYLIAAKLCEGTKDTAISRIARRFALVQVALGLAHKYGLLPFDIAQVDWAISTCFKDWLDARGGDGSIEIKNAIRLIEHLIASEQLGNRVRDVVRHKVNGNQEDKSKSMGKLLGYRFIDIDEVVKEFWVTAPIFDKEFCSGVNKTELVKELQRIGWLDLSSEGKTRQRTMDEKTDRYYVFRKWKKEGDEGDEGDD